MKNKRTKFIVVLTLVIGGIYLYKNKPVDQISTSTINVQQYASSTNENTTVSVKSVYKPSISPSLYLTSKTWFWIDTLRPAGQPIYESRDHSKFKLTFSNDKENTFSASTDCNSIGGEYEIIGNKITFDKMISTKMYREDSQEAEYSKMLAQVVRFEITDSSPGELLFTLKDGSIMLYRQ